MRRFVLLLTVSCLGWPGVMQGWAQQAAVQAEAAGFALGSLERSPVVDQALEHAAPHPAELSTRPAPAIQPEIEVLEPEESAALSPGVVKRRLASPPPTRASSANAVAPRRGLRVRSNTVLQLANARAIPEGTYVEPDRGRPGGMRLSGVGVLGVGLADGDVLSHVGGAPVTSRSAVVTAVLQARARRASEISALFWRDGEPWRLVVEMPYLPESKTL